MTDRELEEYLRENGYPERVVRAGRKGLIDGWDRFVAEVEQGYRLGLEEYRNSLDLRGVIELMGGAEAAVYAADERLHALLFETGKRVWESSGGDPFWDFGYPRNASGKLLLDLRAAGIAP
ncbi:MAG TPA: hypothetical protein VMZ52_14050 [Bryobacteraceae bacterium]|nr:hypothetical protein [Bryobacteraceae bacterium]